MKKIAISLRVDSHSQEKRDAVDQKLVQLIYACGYEPYLIPTHLPCLQAMIRSLSFDGFVFSGGNTLKIYGGDAEERDDLEEYILKYCIQKRKALLGICRGMQLIQNHFEIPLVKIVGHVSTVHWVKYQNSRLEKNSYHEFGTKHHSTDLITQAEAEDGVIESVRHKYLPIYGIMWHPERNDPYHTEDIKLIQKIFK